MLPLIGQAVETLGSLANSAYNWHNQKKVNEQEIALANSAHQREVADLRRAGLNPILTATGGQGLGTPQLQGSHSENPLAGASATAINAARLRNENALNAATIGKINADTAVAHKALQVADVDIESKKAQILLNAATAAYTNARTPREQAIGEVYKGVLHAVERFFGRDKSGSVGNSVVDSILNVFGTGEEPGRKQDGGDPVIELESQSGNGPWRRHKDGAGIEYGGRTNAR